MLNTLRLHCQLGRWDCEEEDWPICSG